MIYVPIMLKDLLNFRDIANFQGGKCNFAPISLKISAMEGEIFWAFLILGTVSIMVSRRIFDIRDNYVERFVKNRDIASFQGGKYIFAPTCLKISAMEGEIFWAFLILGTMSIMVSEWIFDIRSNYVERFVKFSGYSEFSRWKMYLCTNLSQKLCDGGRNIFGFLILVRMSITVQRRIFDKRANYVERFVKYSGYSEFSRWKM